MSDTAVTTSVQTFYPTMRYADARAAIAWLRHTFGFEEDVCYAAEDGSVAHAQLRFGSGVIMLGSVRDDDYPMVPPGPGGSLTGGVYVAVSASEIDAHYARAEAAGARIGVALRDTDYGSREYSAYDCEGFLWSFGTYRP